MKIIVVATHPDDETFLKKGRNLIPWARVIFKTDQKRLVIKLLMLYFISDSFNHFNRQLV